MNRVLLIVNVVLAAVLVFQICSSDADAVQAAETSESRILATDLRVSPVLDGEARHRFLVDVGKDVGPLDAESAPPIETDLRLDPEMPFTARWVSPRVIEVITGPALPRGKQITLHFAEELEGEEASVPAGESVTFATDGIRRLRIVREGDDPSKPVLLVGVDSPVVDEDLIAHLELRTESGDTVAFEAENAGFANEQAFRVRPTLPEGQRVEVLEIAVRKGLRPRGGDVALARRIAQEVRLVSPLHLKHVAAKPRRIVLGLSHSVPVPEKGQVRIEPEVPFELVRNYEGLQLVGDFPAGRPVTVHLESGFPGRGGVRLPDAVRRSVLIPDHEPSLEFTGQGRVLSTMARPELRLKGVNVSSFTVSMQRIYPNNVVRYLGPGRRDRGLTAPETKVQRNVDAPRNEEFTEVLSLEQLLGKAPRGVFWVRARSDKDYHGDSELLQITDLAVTARTVAGRMAVQATSLARGTPAAGAQVTVWTATNQVLVQGRLDQSGVAMLTWDEAAGDAEPFAVQVQHGDDVAFVDLSSFGVELASPGLGGRPFAAENELEALVHFSRGIAQPGETLEATALVRNGVGIAPSGRELELRWVAPDGRVWRQERSPLHGSGVLTATLPTRGSTPSGRWRLDVVDPERETTLGSGAILVQPFVPDRLEAEVLVEEHFRFGSPAAIAVRGRWLDGTPAAGQPVHVRVRFDHSPWRSAADDADPEQWAGFSFGSLASGRGMQPPPPGALPSLHGVLDEDGSVVFRVPVPGAAWSPCLTATFHAEVEDPSGRVVRATGRTTAWRQDFHLGLRPLAAGVEIAAVDSEGRAVPVSHAATVQLELRKWQMRRVRRGMNRWRYKTEVAAELLTELPASLVDGRTRVSFSSAMSQVHDGWLVAVVSCGGQRAEVSLGAVPMPPDRLRVSAAGAVRAGDAAVLTVESPVAGRGFVTIEGTDLHGAEVVSLDQGTNRVLVPVPTDVLTPNVHAVVTLTRPQAVQDAKGPFWIVGACSIEVQHRERALAVAVSTPNAEDGTQAPETPLHVDVRAPGALRATVAVVDRGVLNRTGHRPVDPAAWFQSARRAKGRGADSGTRLWDEVRFDPGVISGGDGLDDALGLSLRGSVDTRVRPLALFREIGLDASGNGRATFELPQYEGRVQIVVLAAGSRGVGHVAAELPIAAPLGVQLAGPRKARPGDLFSLPVTFTNRTESGGDVVFELQPVGDLGLSVPLTRTVPVAASAVETVDVSVVVGAGERQGIVVVARLGDEERRVQLDFPVEPAAPWQSWWQGVAAGVDEDWSATVPDDFEGDARLRFRVDDRPDSALRPVLESMLAYPYGCLEQTCSKGQVLLSCQALLPQLYGEEETPPDVAGLADAAVQRVLSMQRYTGGFGWWSASTEWDFGTVLATDLLLRAKAQGLFVPDDALDRAVNRVERTLRRERASTSLRAHAAFVVAGAGRPVQPWLDLLVARAESLEDRARLAWCLARSGQGERAVALLEGDPADREEASSQQTMLSSPLRTEAYLLRAGFLADPTNPRWAGIAARLTRASARPETLTTQERAVVLRALSEWYAGQGERRRPVRGTVRVGNREQEVRRGEWMELVARAGDAVVVTVDGPAWGALQVVGRRRPPATVESEGLTIQRKIVDDETGEAVTTLQRGRVYRVELDVRSRKGAGHLAVVDLLPGCLEGEADSTPTWDRPDDVNGVPVLLPDALERRDDRIVWLRSARLPEHFVATWKVRATLPGTWHWPALYAEGMYDPALHQRGGKAQVLEVRP